MSSALCALALISGSAAWASPGQFTPDGAGNIWNWSMAGTTPDAVISLNVDVDDRLHTLRWSNVNRTETVVVAGRRSSRGPGGAWTFEQYAHDVGAGWQVTLHQARNDIRFTQYHQDDPAAAGGLRTLVRRSDTPTSVEHPERRPTGIGRTGDDRISTCPDEFFASNEHAGEVLLQTCARAAAHEDEVGFRAVDMIATASRGGHIETVWLNLSGRSGVVPFADNSEHWPWVVARPLRAIALSQAFELVWGEDDTLVSLETYVDEQPNGHYVVFYADGTPAVFGEYRDGLQHGVWGWLDRAGTLTSAYLYLYGVEVTELSRTLVPPHPFAPKPVASTSSP